MEIRYLVTEAGLNAGWVAMHNGGFCQNVSSRYLPFGSYVPATIAQIEQAVTQGLIQKQFGNIVHLGGILHDFVPCD